MSCLVVRNSGTRKDLARKNLAPKKQNPTAFTFSAREHGQGTFSFWTLFCCKIGRPVGLPSAGGPPLLLASNLFCSLEWLVLV